MNARKLTDAWQRGFNQGAAYVAGYSDDTPERAASDMGLEEYGEFDREGNVSGTTTDGRVIVICNYHGPMAVDVTEEINERPLPRV